MNYMYSLFLDHYTYLIFVLLNQTLYIYLCYLIKLYFKISCCKRTLMIFVLIQKIHSYIYISKEAKKSIILKVMIKKHQRIFCCILIFWRLILVIKKSFLLLMPPAPGRKVQVNIIIYCLFLTNNHCVTC